MDFLLTKILPLALYPLGTTLALLAICFLTARFGWRRISMLSGVVAFLYLWAASTPIVGEHLQQSLETQYPPRSIEDTPTAQTAIILGGVVGYLAPPRFYPEMETNAGRVAHGARLFKAGRVSSIVITGGNYPWGPGSPSEAEQIATLLVEWGIPRDAIHLETESLNTRQNATNTRTVLERLNIETALLVTSGFHMPRALATFQAVGLNPIPATSGVRIVQRPYQFPLDYLPQVKGLLHTSRTIKEWIGMAVYSFRGWM